MKIRQGFVSNSSSSSFIIKSNESLDNLETFNNVFEINHEYKNSIKKYYETIFKTIQNHKYTVDDEKLSEKMFDFNRYNITSIADDLINVFCVDADRDDIIQHILNSIDTIKQNNRFIYKIELDYSDDLYNHFYTFANCFENIVSDKFEVIKYDS